MNEGQEAESREEIMAPSLPVCCAPDSFRLLGAQVKSIESTEALLGGAVAISMHAVPNVSLAAVDAKLQRYADTIRKRVRGKQPQALVAHLHTLLFDDEGFAGNNEDYYNADNSYVPLVLETKRGLPITVSLIYRDVASRIGLRSWGVNLPGHFLVGVELHGSTMLVDPFAQGRVVDPKEAHERLRQVFGDEVEWSSDLLQPADNRIWLTRMLQNLLNTYGSMGRYPDVAAMLEMEMLLWPEEARLQRDLALVLARCGLSEPARTWLDLYLKGNPDDPQKRDLKQLLEVLTA